MTDIRHNDKEITWLSFNERVLQEAGDKSNLLGERFRFLGIFSSNQDEFFRVRVATLKRLCMMNKTEQKYITGNPRETLNEIKRIVHDQRQKSEKIYAELMKELAKKKILIVNEKEIDDFTKNYVSEFFENKVRPVIFPMMIEPRYRLPYLKDYSLYFLVVLIKKNSGHESRKYSIIEIPKKILPRFIHLPSGKNEKRIMFIDDVLRSGLERIFESYKFDEFNAYNLKITRDAELEIDSDNINYSYVDQINESLRKRKEGDIIRLVYDRKMPSEVLSFLLKKLNLSEYDTISPGGRYHNLKDLIAFPEVAGLKTIKKLPAIEPASIEKKKDVFHSIRKSDILLYFPYHSFGIILDWLRDASIDPAVISIKVSLYRVATFSSIANALINARKNRKEVTVHFELQARFDEENNIFWARRLKEEGIKVFFGIEGLKVHSKLCLVTRKERTGLVRYCSIGTGNLNEVTSSYYTDCCLLTADESITKEIDHIFSFLEKSYSLDRSSIKELLVAPFNLRSSLYRIIDNERRNAMEGKEAWLRIKLNNLSDRGIEKKLYDASRAGVEIRIICRSRFTVLTGIQGLSENIKAVSIVDKFLEHARFFICCNDGDNLAYLGSADFSTRNIDRRVEVIVPVKKKSLVRMLRDIFDIQWKDSKKARILDYEMNNFYRKKKKNEKEVRSQDEVYEYLLKNFL